MLNMVMVAVGWGVECGTMNLSQFQESFYFQDKIPLICCAPDCDKLESRLTGLCFRSAKMNHGFTKQQIDRFWNNVNVGEVWECWNWKLSTDRYGYGKVKISHGCYISHRAAYEMHHGSIPDEKHILHSCDNPICCNPNHLHPGTRSENMQEMIRRGRHGKGYTYKAKMTREKVDMLKIDFNSGMSKHALSRKYNISCRTVREILSGEIWRRVS